MIQFVTRDGWRPHDPPATREEIDQAREKYGSDDVEIDEGAKASRTDEGTWVAAWVWLAKEEA